jgi:GNAT superfamily N-acetyltransferase
MCREGSFFKSLDYEKATTMISSERNTGTITLSDGTVLPFRPIAPIDQAALQRFHARLSDRSVHQRFFHAQPALCDDQAHRFTHLDGYDRFALIAIDPDLPSEIAGVVRFDREPGSDHAEYAAVVADRWQGRGLGMALTRLLVDAAKARGVHWFDADVLPDNRRMLGLFEDLHLPERIRHRDSIDKVEIDLTDISDVDEA